MLCSKFLSEGFAKMLSAHSWLLIHNAIQHEFGQSPVLLYTSGVLYEMYNWSQPKTSNSGSLWARMQSFKIALAPIHASASDKDWPWVRRLFQAAERFRESILSKGFDTVGKPAALPAHLHLSTHDKKSPLTSKSTQNSVLFVSEPFEGFLPPCQTLISSLSTIPSSFLEGSIFYKPTIPKSAIARKYFWQSEMPLIRNRYVLKLLFCKSLIILSITSFSRGIFFSQTLNPGHT